MSSIAYITDQKLIEFVRSSGTRELNFWRSSMRNFELFSKGSLLFFVDGRMQSRNNGEKGIIGYGRAKGFKKMSPKKMWKEYGTLNGYHDYLAFVEAIMSSAKAEKLPKNIQSIFLDEIVIFNGPVYLSEIGIDLPIQLESYTYLDKTTINTDKLLNKAKTIGIDSWYQAFNQQLSLDDIESQIHDQELRLFLGTISHPFTKQQHILLDSYNCDYKINCIGYNINETGTQIIIPCTSVKLQQYGIMGVMSAIKNDKRFENVSFKVILRKSIKKNNLQFHQGIVLEYI